MADVAFFDPSEFRPEVKAKGAFRIYVSYL